MLPAHRMQNASDAYRKIISLAFHHRHMLFFKHNCFVGSQKLHRLAAAAKLITAFGSYCLKNRVAFVTFIKFRFVEQLQKFLSFFFSIFILRKIILKPFRKKDKCQRNKQQLVVTIIYEQYERYNDKYYIVRCKTA